MHVREVEATAEYLLRPETGQDWREQVEAFAREHGIEAAWFQGMGAVADAELWYYDQREGTYRPLTLEEHLEVSACVGNVSLLDGELFAHTHAVLGREDGTTLSGHLHAGTVFAGELHCRAFERPLERHHHEQTDLDLWL